MNTASLKDLERRFSTLLIQQENVLTQPFGYWDEPKPRRSSHIYELRTYKLRVFVYSIATRYFKNFKNLKI